MYTLIKHSSPRWSHKFDSIETLTAAVSDHTCQLCKNTYGLDLESMRSSDCGCEYSIEGIEMDEPATEAEQWQIYLEGK